MARAGTRAATLEEARRRAEEGWGPDHRRSAGVTFGPIRALTVQARVESRRHSGAAWLSAVVSPGKALAEAEHALAAYREQGYPSAEARIRWTVLQDVGADNAGA